jgi:hypothetical protein
MLERKLQKSLLRSTEHVKRSMLDCNGSTESEQESRPWRARVKGEGKMTDNEASASGPNPHVDFAAPASLRKWPSLNNERRAFAAGPYLLVDGTLDECIREFMARPAPSRHLYEIHTSPQSPLVADVLSGEIVAELARLREFL